MGSETTDKEDLGAQLRAAGQSADSGADEIPDYSSAIEEHTGVSRAATETSWEEPQEKKEPTSTETDAEKQTAEEEEGKRDEKGRFVAKEGETEVPAKETKPE